MAVFLLTTAVLLGIVCVELRPKRGERERRALSISLTFLLPGYLLLVLTSFGVQLPSPVELLGRLMGVW